jgi:DNA polymerase III sliding clamp (beta) subunit (PCNA family)
MYTTDKCELDANANWVVYACISFCHFLNSSISAIVIMFDKTFFPLGLNMQAMDTSNVCLVQMELNADSFDPYRCDKNMILGIDLKK